jgi:hypothetical protein
MPETRIEVTGQIDRTFCLAISLMLLKRERVNALPYSVKPLEQMCLPQ